MIHSMIKIEADNPEQSYRSTLKLKRYQLFWKLNVGTVEISKCATQ